MVPDDPTGACGRRVGRGRSIGLDVPLLESSLLALDHGVAHCTIHPDRTPPMAATPEDNGPSHRAPDADPARASPTSWGVPAVVAKVGRSFRRSLVVWAGPSPDERAPPRGRSGQPAVLRHGTEPEIPLHRKLLPWRPKCDLRVRFSVPSGHSSGRGSHESLVQCGEWCMTFIRTRIIGSTRPSAVLQR
jgi:hypothetical protein